MYISFAKSFFFIRILPLDPNYLNTSDELSESVGNCLCVDAAKAVWPERVVINMFISLIDSIDGRLNE
jgi:hypothetical protein